MAPSGAPADELHAQVSRWAREGEKYDVEFKGEQREGLNDRDLVEAVVCLTNGRGGVLLAPVKR